jgi:transcriptional regulator with PAS, ATPase and Fis domain
MLTVERALRYENILAENESLKETLRTKYHFSNLVGDSPGMRRVYEMIEKVARRDATVLILGESGTGKELVAKALHYSSKRAEKPFVAINCAALPETLLESELFGYVKGAFTGANRFKKGLFESADGGTLLLDEVGSIPINTQLTLLRVLQEREIRPVGGTRSVPVDVRIVAATNEDLTAKIKASLFREDLFYRLSVIPIVVPPLRERQEDVPLLVRHFLTVQKAREGHAVTIEPRALRALQAYAWPGNVRELENMIARASALCDRGVITVNDLPEEIRSGAPAESDGREDAGELAQFEGRTLKAYVRAKEREYIEHVLRQCGGHKERTAKALGISLASFYRKYGAD